MRKEKIPLLIVIIVLGSILSPVFVHTSHAATGVVCMADPSTSPCPVSPAVFAGPVGQEIRIGIFISASDGLDGFDITLLTNHTVLTPVRVDLTGGVLLGSPTIVDECLQGFLIQGSTCASTDTIDTIHLAATSSLGSPLTSAPTTGLLFTAIYHITGTSSRTQMGFQTGCPAASVTNNCITIANGSPTPDSETVQTGTTFNNSASAGMALVVLSSSRTSFGPEFPNTSSIATINATAVNGFPGLATDSVTFTDKSSAGLTATITGLNPCATAGGTCSVTISLTAISAGNYSVTVFGTYSTLDSSGNPDTLTSSIIINVIVYDFGIILSRTTLSFASGSTSTDVVTLSSLNGFVGPISLSTGAVVPSGLTISFNPSSVILVAGSSANSTATFSAAPSATTTYHSNIRAISGTRVKTSATITVAVILSIPDFALAASPNSLTITPGFSAKSTLSIMSLNGFSGIVRLNSTVVSSNLNVSISPANVTLATGQTATSIFTISISPSTPLGTYSAVVAGVSGSSFHAITISIKVGTFTQPDFSISANPIFTTDSLSTITVTATGGFNGNVTLTFLAPGGISCQLNPVLIVNSGTSLLLCAPVTAGIHIVTIAGASSSLTHSVTVIFNIIPTPIAVGLVCVAKDGSSSCPVASPIIDSSASVPTQIRVAIIVNASTGINGFDITLLADHTILKPVGIDLTNSVLIGTPIIFLECISGHRIVGSASCPSTDTNDTIQLVASSALGSPNTITPTTGLLFTAIYNVTGTSSETVIGFQTGCHSTSVTGGICVTLSNGTPTPSPETVQTGLFANTPTFAVEPMSTVTPLKVAQGSSNSSLLLRATSANNFTGTITITSIVSPSGPTGTFSPTSVTLGASNPTSLIRATVTATSSVLPRSYNLTIMVTSGTTSRSLTILLLVTTPDFSITVNPQSLTFNPGQSATTLVTVTSFGFKGMVTIATLSPTGLTSSAQQQILSLNPNGANSSSLIVNSIPSTQGGRLIVLITASSGSLSHSVELIVNVPDFVLDVQDTSISLTEPLLSLSILIGVESTGETGTANVAASAPPGLTVTFGSSQFVVIPLIPGQGFQFGLTISATPSTPAGVYVVNVTAIGPTSTHTRTILVKVVPPPPPDFEIIAPGFLNVVQGNSSVSTIQVFPLNGFAGNVTLTATTTSSGPTVRINPLTIHLNSGRVASSVLNITAIIPGSLLVTPLGSYNITIAGTSGGLVHAVLVIVSVTTLPPPPPPDFMISATPVFLTVHAGGRTNSTVTLTSLFAFQGNVTLTASILPSISNAPSLSLQPSQILLVSGGSRTSFLLISTTRDIPIQNYEIFVTGTTGAINHAVRIFLAVLPPLDTPPVANFTFTPGHPTVNQQVTFNGTSSFDPDGFVQLWTWNFGDGSGLYISTTPLIDHTFFSPGNYSVLLTVQDNVGLTGSKSATVNVIPRPMHDVSILGVFLGSQTAVASQRVVITVYLRDDGTSAENVSVTVYANGHVIQTLSGLYIQNCGNNCFYFLEIVWDTTNVSPGQYTISATIFLPAGEVDPTPQDNSLTDGTITIFPPPVIVAIPASGVVGAKIVVEGSGFPLPNSNGFGPPFDVIEVTFDDMNLGFVVASSGTFNFTLDVPLAQPGPHQLKALDEIFGAHTTGNFQVLPNQASIVVTVNTGAVYFPGDMAAIYVLTSVNGSPTSSNGLQLQLMLVYPNGTLSSLKAASVSPGLYRATFAIPKSGSLGTYSLVATAQAPDVTGGVGLGGFEVQPSWLSSHASSVAGGTAVAGVFGFAAFAWHKGYFRKKNDNEPRQPEERAGMKN